VAKWHVKMTDTAEIELKKLLRTGTISKLDVKVLLRWVDEMEEFGPQHIASSPDWHDHALERDWAGYRSSAFSSAGRLIYKVVNSEIIVEVHKVTTDHNYKR
jgi:mRNA-degrading endonuclease YafQ of YafQ-DinJ toxin-antitoxin module